MNLAVRFEFGDYGNISSDVGEVSSTGISLRAHFRTDKRSGDI